MGDARGVIGDSVEGVVVAVGWLMYATCTLLSVENAEVVAAVVGPELAEVPLGDVLGERAPGLGDGNAFTMTPHRHGSDGFYARVMRRID